MDDTIYTATINGVFAGSAGALFPNLALVNQQDGTPAQQQWDWDMWVESIQFSTTLTVFPSVNTNLSGMLLTVDKQNSGAISIAPGLKSVICHLTGPNSIAGPPAFALPSTKVSHIPFRRCGYLLKAQTPISLYAFADATAGNVLAAVVSIQARRVA